MLIAELESAQEEISVIRKLSRWSILRMPIAGDDLSATCDQPNTFNHWDLSIIVPPIEDRNENRPFPVDD